MQKKDDEQLMRKFSAIRRRQHLAVAVALLSVIILAVVSRRPELAGGLSENSIMTWQVLIIWGLVNFTAFNWKCPACKKYLGHDFHKEACKKCGIRLQ